MSVISRCWKNRHEKIFGARGDTHNGNRVGEKLDGLNAWRLQRPQYNEGHTNRIVQAQEMRVSKA